MSRPFGVVDYKGQEAEYFLLQLKGFGTQFNFSAVQFCASAFASAVRSVTFAMQASMGGDKKFDSWYEDKREMLRGEPLAKFFHDFRTVTQHIGEQVIGGVSGDSSGHLYYFTPCPDLRLVPEQDVVSACEDHFISVLQLVFDCYVRFSSRINGQWYFSFENFSKLEKTIEDAEEELGFPRGWTDYAPEIPNRDQYRWQALRGEADRCLIEGQFARWLGKTLPQPECRL